MGGRAGLILVIGFAAILGYISMNMNNLATKAVGNMSMYNALTASHQLAAAGANARLAKFYQDTSDRSTLTQTFDDKCFSGSFTTSISSIAGNQLRLRSVSTYPINGSLSAHDTVDVYFHTTRKNTFTLFAWMTDFEGNVFWVSGDTVWGRVHSNGNLHINGSPVFMEKATTAKTFDPPKVGSGTNKAIFKSGYEKGIKAIDLPTDMSEILTASVSGGRNYSGDIYVVMDPGSSADNDGKAFVYSGNSKSGTLIDSIDLGHTGYNGVLYGGGRVNVEGKLDGALTIASGTDVYVQNDCLYEQNPRTTTSNDILGLVANSNVVVADNAANRSGCNIQGNIFARTGSFLAQNHTWLPLAGELNIYGSVVQKTRGAVATFAGGALKTGFTKRYRYDERLRDGTFSPPSYPGFYVATYSIANWWESYRVMAFNE